MGQKIVLTVELEVSDGTPKDAETLVENYVATGLLVEGLNDYGCEWCVSLGLKSPPTLTVSASSVTQLS